MAKLIIPAKKAVALYQFKSAAQSGQPQNTVSNQTDPTTTCTTVITTTHLLHR